MKIENKEREWEYETCPICGRDYPYAKGEYKPKTCGKFDCLQKYFAHRGISYPLNYERD